MARRQWERALAWKEISPTRVGLGMGSANRIAHPSLYRRAPGATNHRGTAPAVVVHAEIFLSSFLSKGLMHSQSRELPVGRH